MRLPDFFQRFISQAARLSLLETRGFPSPPRNGFGFFFLFHLLFLSQATRPSHYCQDPWLSVPASQRVWHFQTQFSSVSVSPAVSYLFIETRLILFLETRGFLYPSRDELNVLF